MVNNIHDHFYELQFKVMRIWIYSIYEIKYETDICQIICIRSDITITWMTLENFVFSFAQITDTITDRIMRKLSYNMKINEFGL